MITIYKYVLDENKNIDSGFTVAHVFEVLL